MKKVIRNGKVGVLISKGYGAGWYTWEHIDEMLFSPEIIELVEQGVSTEIIEKEAEKLWGDKHYYGGADGLCVEWVKKGKKFRINEYDGAETLVLEDEENYIIA